MTSDLITTVRDQLKRSRTLPTRIDLPLNPEDSSPGQASGGVLKLEEFEQELLLSPLFTPGQAERAACEPVLPRAGLTGEEVDLLIATLARETPCFPVTSGQRSGFCPVPEVVVARYVRLLGLDQPVSAEAYEWIDSRLVGADRDWVMSLARRLVWQTPSSGELLSRVLRVMAQGSAITTDKMGFVTEFVRTYRCFTESELIRGLKSLIESYRIDADHPTFNNPALEDKQGESIRSHHCDEAVRLHRVAMARELLADFGKNSRVP
ncbi:MAG: hypothetical protein HQL98_05605 [Magnetococcales bacterium]|nr:hypothetical protein [Magnetococcales bacterium]